MSLFDQRPNSLTRSGIPDGQVIGSFSKYADAQKVVDHLSDQQFEVKAVSIVGHDLHSIEQVTGRLTYPRVALLSAWQGVMFGLFFGVILALFGSGGWGMPVLLTALLGAAFWMILGVVSFAAQRGRRDFTSVSTVVAARYDVVARADLAAAARQSLEGLNLAGLHSTVTDTPDAPSQPQQSTASGAQESTSKSSRSDWELPDGSPRYGVRLDPSDTNSSSSHDQPPQS